MDNINVSKLEKIITNGKLNYVLVHGVLGWGVVTALLFSLLRHFTIAPQSVGSVSINLIVFSIGGLIFGLVMWTVLKNKYARLKHKKL